jgi:hypothetical protein
MQQWIIEEISIFGNSSHLEWRAGLSDTILEGIHPWFGLIWKGVIQGPFHQSLVAIGPVVSEEKIKM